MLKCIYCKKKIDTTKDDILKKHDGKPYHDLCLIKYIAQGAK